MAEPLPVGGQSLTRAGVALVSTSNGDIGGHATGLFVRDRRMVRTLTVSFGRLRSELLSVSRTGASSDQLLYGLFATGRDPIALIYRDRSIDQDYRESFTLHSFVDELELDVEVCIAAGGATVYGLDQPEPSAKVITWLSDKLTPGTFDHVAAEDGSHTLRAHVNLSAAAPSTLTWSIQLNAAVPTPVRRATVSSNDRRLDHILRTSQRDLDALRVIDPATGAAFLAAGAPHFLAAFGRDALITSLLSIAGSTDRALDTLRVFANHQGTSHDPTTLEEPGRIAHELRIGDMGVFGVPPGTPYYASIDATPLFVIVLETCWRWGADPQDVTALLPAARRAMRWCRAHVDDLGFVHSQSHEQGLGNQGWKDSADSMVRTDGSIVAGQTSPAEVQGYVYQAFNALAALEADLGDHDQAAELRHEAARFAAQFERHFGLPAPVEVALALDGDGVPLAVRASNVGHLLDSGLLDDQRATRLVKRLMSSDEFSGWGVRTLAVSEAAYKPFGYHLGTVWPHDNAILLRGLVRRGFTDYARTLIDALLDLAEARNGQLPELISGLPRSASSPPVPYLSSARPQAWAAAVPIQIATSLLGLEVDAPGRTITYRPLLRSHEHLIIEDLTIGDRHITVEARGSMVSVTGDLDDLHLIARS